MSFGSSADLRLGQTVIAIGNALAEFKNSVSVGVVSGLSRSIVASNADGTTEELYQVIQTDAAINPGNSGGPLLNIDGEVVGVNVAISKGAENIGFALPATVVKQIVKSVAEYGEIIRPFLGVRYVMIEEPITFENSTTVTFGALITGGAGSGGESVQPNSPASNAGLKEGDIILSIDDVSLFNSDLSAVLRTKSVNDTVIIEFMRNGITEKVTVALRKAL